MLSDDSASEGILDMSRLSWHPAVVDFVEDIGLDRQLVLDAVREPERVGDDVTRLGMAAKTFQRGDLFVAVGVDGYAEGRDAVIIHVKLLSDRADKHRGGTGGGGSTGTSSGPTTPRALRQAAVALGFKIEPGTRHDRIVDPISGSTVTTVPNTPSDGRSIPNTWAAVKRFQRNHPTSNGGAA
jgi:hypothetical protein